MRDAHTLIPMGVGEPEAFRERIYSVADDPEAESKRRAFLTELAGPGVIDGEHPEVIKFKARCLAGLRTYLSV